MKKRLTTLFLCLCLVFTMLPATALAGEEQNDGTGAEPGAGCICTGLCGEESINKDCPVCSVEGIDLTVCQGEETQPDTPETLTEAPTDVTESSREGLGTEDVIITDDSEGVETEGTEGTEETETEELASGCICTELCTGDNINGECPLCGARGADLTACKGVESQPDTQAKAAPAPAVTPRIAYDTLWIGNTRITDSGYWITDGNGNLTASDAGNYNVAFDADTNTLTLNNANIAGQYDLNYNGSDAGIWAYSRSGAVSLNIQVTGNNVVSGSIGIYVLSNGGEVSVTISGGGSLTASGSQNGISIVSEFSNAALAIEGTAVKASGSYSEGVWVQAGESSTGSLSVDGGSLTASGNTGIEFLFSTGMSGSGTPSLTVAGNAVVDAKSGGIAHNSSNNLSIQGNSGIVFNGSTGTVYGNASLQKDLIIGEGESLILDHGANLDANGHNVIVDGGRFDWKGAGVYPWISEANASYHGASFVEAAPDAAFVTYIRAVLLRDTGAAISPFHAFLLLQGLETLSLRVERHVENALRVVEYLHGHPQVERVNHPSVSEDPQQQPSSPRQSQSQHHAAQLPFLRSDGSFPSSLQAEPVQVHYLSYALPYD